MAEDIDTEYRKLLLQKIRTVFETNVSALHVLFVFHKYDPNVLTMKDLDIVKICCNHKGYTEGASLLLKYLSRYAGWFKCLLSVLRDPSVKQASLADQLQAMKGYGYEEANGRYGDYNRNYILPTLRFSNVADELDEELQRKNAFQRVIRSGNVVRHQRLQWRRELL